MNELLVLLPIVAMFGFFGSLFALPVWGMVDAARRPEAAFRRAGHNRTMWLAGMGGGMVFGILPGTAIAVAYLLGARPKLAAAAAAGDVPAFDVLPPADRDPRRVRRRRVWLLVGSAAFGVLALAARPVPDDDGEICRPPMVIWNGSAESECEGPERDQLAMAGVVLLVTAASALLVRHVPPEQRFRGVYVQLGIGVLLVAGAAGTVTANPEWFAYVLRGLALVAGAWLVQRAVRLVPARRSAA